jgi:anthranilate phosphoribosyltransferase
VGSGEVTERVLNPERLGLQITSLEALLGGDAHHNAEVARQLFAGSREANLSAVRDVVLLNAASGVVSYRLAKNSAEAGRELHERFSEALALVTEALDSGATEAKLSQWMSATQA